ncbi:MAG: YkgJ family cysteine cluster protein [Chitinispirillaceae bacterium]|nr:YkgJ family cysteine cluster protein [Chitinispirillaceae bacterium]
MATTREFTIRIGTPDGTVGPARVSVSGEPLQLADLVPPIHELASGVVDLAIKRAEKEGQRLSCKPGCGVCCCQLVPLAPAEAFYMVDRLRAMPRDERIPILERFQSIEAILIETGLRADLGSIDKASDSNSIARAYFALRRPCPFLVHDSCSIHPWRPIACREYNVTSPPALCADPFSNSIASIRLHRRISAGLTKFCAETAGLPPGLVPMPLLFDYYETYRETAEKTWPGVELFDRVLEYVCGKKE